MAERAGSRWRGWLRGRAAAYLLVVLVLAGIVAGLAYVEGQNREAIRAINEFRSERSQATTATAVRLCQALQVSRDINNRDRATIVRGIVSTQRLAAALRRTGERIPGYDPKKALAGLRQDLRDRPHLAPLHCQQLPIVRSNSAEQKKAGAGK